ncbi:hypothetical protein AB3331_07870 [Streptococcus sp. H49]|uniref:hypothetical protein n=1 Tax=Streptococcus huangxiaojuni TaxID=3237239 RepID=UPI0034A220A6
MVKERAQKTKINKKQSVSVALFIVITVLLDGLLNKQISILLFSSYYFVMLFYWRSEIISKLKEKWELWRQIRDRKYFFINDPKNTTDIIKRREVSFAFLLVSYAIFFAIIFFVNIFPIRNIDIFSNVFAAIFRSVFIILFIALILYMRYYFVSFYYYIIPIVVLIAISGNGIEKISETDVIIKYFLIIILVYIAFALLLPLPYLRKITNSTLVGGTILSIIVPTMIEYFLSNYLLEQLSYEELTSQMIMESDFPVVIATILRDEQVMGVINEFANLLLPVIAQTQLGVFSTVSFLWLSGYTIGRIVIDQKVRLGDIKAQDIFNKVIYGDETVEYSSLRDIVYYGNELYRYRILDNSSYRMIINEFESQKEILSINHHWSIKIIIVFSRWILEKLKSLI